MKRYFSFVLLVFILLMCSSCTSKKDYEGQWYSARTGEMYEFYNGDIFCKDNFITLDSGEETSGGYILKDDGINAYVVEHTSPETMLYLIKNDGNIALSDKLDGTGTVYFYRDKSVAEKIVEDRKNLNNKEFIYCNSFSDNTNKTLRWEGMKAQVPHTWDEPEYEKINITSINAEGSSTYLVKFDTSELQNDVDELLTNQQHFNRINKYLTDYFKGERYSNKGQELKHPNFKYVDNMYYQEGTHPVINNKGVLMVKHSADYERFTTYCFVVGENIYTWTLIERSNDRNSSIKDFEKVINTVDVNDDMASQVEDTETTSATSTGNTSEINVTFSKDSIDGNNMLLKVYVKNTSQSKFNGNIHVYFYSTDRKTRLGSDTIIVKDLMPGQQSWSNVTIDKYPGTPLMEKEFTNVKFTSIDSSSNVVDDYKTDKTKNSVRLNFDIASWYKYIKSIKVYTDGTCEVIVTPSSDDTVIASSVWSCGHEYGVKSIKVIDQSGKILAVFSK